MTGIDVDARHAAVPLAEECSTCQGSRVIREEGQIGVPTAGGVLTCPDCVPGPVQRLDDGGEFDD